MIGCNEARRHCQQGSEERRSRVRNEVKDNRDTIQFKSHSKRRDMTERSHLHLPSVESSTKMWRCVAGGGSGHTAKIFSSGHNRRRSLASSLYWRARSRSISLYTTSRAMLTCGCHNPAEDICYYINVHIEIMI